METATVASKSYNSTNYQSQAMDVSWVVYARVCFLGIALLSASFASFLYENKSSQELEFIYLPIALLFAFCGLSGLWLIWKRTGIGFAYVQFITDILVITGVVYITGGTISPFVFLYLPLIMIAATLLPRRHALIISALSAISYAALAWVLMNGWLSPADGSTVVSTPPGGLIVQTMGLFSAMLLVAVATSFLANKLHFSYALAEKSQRDLSELTNRQRLLIEGVPAGVITCRLDGTVASLNRSASKLLGVHVEQAVDQHISELMSNSDAEQSLLNDFSEHAINHGELTLTRDGSDEESRVSYTVRPLETNDGVLSGMLVILQDLTQLRSVEEQLATQERMARLLARSDDEEIENQTELPDFVGESRAMQQIFKLIRRVAPSDATVLIDGESGTGKELVAKAIHLGSNRSAKTFVTVNCGAIPENLIESELFGHKKGSFTGADSNHIGMFQQAEGGTIFLDEIGELPLSMQTKLLRAIQNRRIRPIGGERDVDIDVRIISATNRNLKDEVEKGTFREDLFYRLNVIGISLPSLKERKEDIPLLVNSLLSKLLSDTGEAVVAPETMKLLLNYNYPGNVRELENMLERAVVLGGEAILPEHLPEAVREYNSSRDHTKHAETQFIFTDDIEFPINLDELLSTIEKHYLEVALVKTQGAKKKAADLLGINFRSLRYRLQKFEIAED